MIIGCIVLVIFYTSAIIALIKVFQCSWILETYSYEEAPALEQRILEDDAEEDEDVVSARGGGRHTVQSLTRLDPRSAGGDVIDGASGNVDGVVQNGPQDV